MPSIHIRNVDDAVVAALKARAHAHNRSLQGELREILSQAAMERIPEADPLRNLKTVRVGGQARFDREEIYGDNGR